MVCKELDELCAKFKSLSPHLRIDYIYGMLRMCLPPELRFIGSVVEDLAKKDFNHLREHENRANNQAELMKYELADERTLIERMAFNLSLLHSVNTACANIIFNLLDKKSKSAFHITNTTDNKTIDIILLVLTMAKYHPAFTFHQRSVFAEFYKTVEQQLHNIVNKTNVAVPPTSSSFTDSEPTDTTLCDSQSVHVSFDSVNNLPQPPVHDRGIETLCIRQNYIIGHDNQPEFPIQVTWADGNITEIFKSYQEIKDFVVEMCRLFPDVVTDHVDLRDILQPGNIKESIDEKQQKVIQCVQFMSSVPKHVKDSTYFSQFCLQENTAKTSTPHQRDRREFEEPVCLPPIATVPPFTTDHRNQFHSPVSSGNGSLNNSRSTSPETESATVKHMSPQSKKSPPHSIRDQLSELSIGDEVKDPRVPADGEEKPRMKIQERLPNGVIEQQYMVPPWYTMHPPPQPMYHHPPFRYQFSAPVLNSREASSPENSSPSFSPVPQKKPPQRGEEISSDESEKGANIDFAGADIRNASHNMEEVAGKTGPTGCRSNSGYQSDPTPTQGSYVQLYLTNNNNFKPPFTRGNGYLSNKTVVNMPDVLTGRPIPYGYPYIRPEIFASSATTGVSQRPVIHTFSQASVRSPTINTSGHTSNTFVCSVTSSAHSIMTTNPQNLNQRPKFTLAPNNSESAPNLQRSDLSSSSPVSNVNPVNCSDVNGHAGYNQAQCTSCGCTGRHNNVPTYQYPVPNQYLNHMMIPQYVAHNGMVPQPIYPQFPYHIPNGISPNYIPTINHYPVPNFTTPQYGCFPYMLQRRNSAGNNLNKPQRSSMVTCSNCGSTDHISTECRENSMESMSSAFHLKYDPKSNSD